MTNSEIVKAAGGAAISGSGVALSYVNAIEQWSRIIASWVAIISGCVVIWSVVYKHYKKKKGIK